jgi:hypothetical protein
MRYDEKGDSPFLCIVIIVAKILSIEFKLSHTKQATT